MMADTLYRWLLFTLPADLRRDFGDDMVQLFRDHRRALAGRPLRLLSLWLAAVHDVIVQAASLRAPRRPRRSPGQVFAPPLIPTLMRTLFADFRHGLRLLRRYPATSLLAVATLAIGIGANTAIFSVVDRVLLRALPYPEPDRLVMVWEKRPRESVMTNVASPADYLDWRARNTVFEHLAAFAATSAAVTGDGEPVQVDTAGVGWSFFEILGVRPQLGRTFRPDDETFGRHRVVVLSHGFWQRRYGGDRTIVGRRLILNGNAWEVIGVLPADFQFIDTFELWAPAVIGGGGTEISRVSHQLEVYARLKSGVSMTQAVDAMDRLGLQLEEEHPAENRGHGAHVTPIRDQFVRPVRATLIVLLAAVAFVLLIACVNVASLLLARAASRRREMAVRSALGASRARLVVQTLAESLSLSAVGGALGVVIGALLLEGLPAVMPERLSIVGLDEIHLDLTMLLFSLALTLATAVVFGILPALHASRTDMTDTLSEGGRGAAGVRKRARIALVIGEVALASLTLVGAGLVIRSFADILSQPLGFEPHGRLALTVSIPPARYKTPQERRAALADIERRLAAVPGVTSVGAINLLPLAGGDSRTGTPIEGREVRPDDPPTRMHPRIVTPDYFKAIGIQIRKGRAFTALDGDETEPVVIISETSARRFWPNDDPLGKRIRIGGDSTIWRTVVGIAGDVRHWGLARPINPVLYWPQAQARSSFLTFVLASDLDPASLTSAARAAVVAVDPSLPLASVRTLDQIVSNSVRAERAQTVLMTTFGVLALLLAFIGIYGVTAQLVSVRIQEIGVRMALGARPVDVLRQVLAEGLWQTVVGLIVGVTAGAYLMTYGTDVLFNVKPWDPATLAGVSVILILAALAACLVPARRAMRVDPVEALRQT